MKNKNHTILSRAFILLIICTASFSMGCELFSKGGSDVGNPVPAVTGSMSTFESETELLDYLKKEFAGSAIPQEAYWGGPEFNAVPPRDTDGDAPAAGDDSENYSDTNTQEQNVDESDMVKTDGTYLYVAGQDKVFIVDVGQPSAMSKASEVIVDGNVDSLYLYNDILIILYRQNDWTGYTWDIDIFPGTDMIGMPYWIPLESKTGILMVDVSTPTSPSTVKNTILDGQLISSRLTDGKLHIVQQYLPELPQLDLYHDGTEEGRQRAVNTNEALLADLDLDDLLPGFEQLNIEEDTTASGRLVEPPDFYHPQDPEGGSIVTLSTFNLTEAEYPMTSIGVVADAHTVYASTQSLYIAATHWSGAGGPIEPLENNSGSTQYQTIIHKFDISGDETTSLGGARVPGQILNQFSLGEHDGVMRVATTSRTSWDADTQNNVYCLSESGTEEGLVAIGSLTGIAPGESIYAARFQGDRGYLVTFVQIDPLFTLDLSDPENPRVAGELKVPGYSEYIHPLGENHLLAIGKDAVEEDSFAWYQGLQLSIFDISDFANPQLAFQAKIGDRGTESEALSNHKAFTFWAEENLLAFPVNLSEHLTTPGYPSQHGTPTFTGLYVYRIDTATGFDFLGRISTGQPDYYWYNNDWMRGVFINDTAFAVEQDTVRNASIDNMENVQTLPLGD